ncbi:MAG TPA: 4-hydroxythreonine-4-phosphate dehydrogenase PdxA [Gammaproteobacteria bacterium]
MAAPAAGRSLHRQEDLTRSPRSAPLVVLTSGEPAGIGPDICLELAADTIDARLVALGDPELFASRARALGIELDLVVVADLAEARPHRSGSLQLLPIALPAEVRPGELDTRNAPAVVEMLETAANACREGQADALVTAPVQKSVISAAGIPFTGHTEFLGELTGVGKPVMLLASSRLRVALATTHLPLARVPEAITRDSLDATIRIVDRDLRRWFGLPNPRICVLGLNPHAGEDGMLGTEEQTTIGPAVAALREDGIDVFGPVSADSAFTATSLARSDVVVAMYHDQGLPVLKAQDFGEIVNVTLGLPIVRTSVDHGTALEIAGTGRASAASLRAAVRLAIEMATSRLT